MGTSVLCMLARLGFMDGYTYTYSNCLHHFKRVLGPSFNFVISKVRPGSIFVWLQPYCQALCLHCIGELVACTCYMLQRSIQSGTKIFSFLLFIMFEM